MTNAEVQRKVYSICRHLVELSHDARSVHTMLPDSMKVYKDILRDLAGTLGELRGVFEEYESGLVVVGEST